MHLAWHRLDYVWRLTSVWLSAMRATVGVGFSVLKFAPTSFQAASIGSSSRQSFGGSGCTIAATPRPVSCSPLASR
jgi:hypothetical protein